jgi:hypothetical protein
MQLEDLLSLLNTEFNAPLESAGNLIWRLPIQPGDTTQQGEIVVLLSEDQSWVRLMVPIAPISQAQPFLQELLELNVEATTFNRYAIAQKMLWGVFNHPLQTLQKSDVHLAIIGLVELKTQGLTHCFETHADRQVRLIISASKRQGLTLKATLQNLERFYREGIIGDLSDSRETIQLTLTRWRDRLERLWSEENLGSI